MVRPKLKDEKKRAQLSISLRKDVLELAAQTENKSRFFECSVDTCAAVSKLVAELEAKKRISATDAADFLENISDRIAFWDAQFEEVVAYDPKTGKTEDKPKRGKRAG